MSPTWLSDLLLNLISEVVGIALTVFLVDRLLKRREQRKWVTSKILVKARLFKIVDGFINNIVGSSFNHSRRGGMYVYYFGITEVMSDGSLRGFRDADFLKEIESRFEMKSLSTEEVNPIIVKTQQKLATLFDLAGHLLEPELIQSLLEFEDRLLSVYDIKDIDEFNENCPMILSGIVCRAAAIRITLENQATKIRPFQEYLEDIRRFAEKLRASGS